MIRHALNGYADAPIDRATNRANSRATNRATDDAGEHHRWPLNASPPDSMLNTEHLFRLFTTPLGDGELRSANVNSPPPQNRPVVRNRYTLIESRSNDDVSYELIPNDEEEGRAAASAMDIGTFEEATTLENAVEETGDAPMTASSLSCVICLATIQSGAICRRIKRCNHVFHPRCLARWVQEHHNCPICRQDLCTHEDESIGDGEQDAATAAAAAAAVADALVANDDNDEIDGSNPHRASSHVDGADVHTTSPSLIANRIGGITSIPL